ncbi:MAG: ATP-binding protein, partial [Bacteroidales bacterium]|nr:ATP-binding protein [Bacteroidales bacterium]
DKFEYVDCELNTAKFNAQDYIFSDSVIYLLKSNKLSAYSIRKEPQKYILKLLKQRTIYELISNINHVDINLNESLVNIEKDNRGNIWGGSNFGLLLVNNFLGENTNGVIYTQSFNSKYSINRNQIKDIYIDKTECLWIGTYEGGANYVNVNRKDFSYVDLNQLVGSNFLKANYYIRAIHRTSSGDYLVGTSGNGLYVLDSNLSEVKRIFSTSNTSSVITNWLSCFYPLSENEVLIGMTSGLSIINTETYTLRPFVAENSDSISFERITNIQRDKFGNFWISSKINGLYHIINDNLGKYHIKRYVRGDKNNVHINSNAINYLYYDNEKNELLVASNKGLNRLVIDKTGLPVKTISYMVNDTSEHSLSSNFIWTVDKMSDNEYWLGTIGGGLNKITFENDVASNDLGSYKAEVYQDFGGERIIDVENVLVDREENKVWFTSQGIFTMSVSSEEKSWKKFDVYDGLQIDKFLAGSMYKSSEGKLFLGAVSGITWFDPAKIEVNNQIPAVVLSELKVRNKKVNPGDMLNNRILLERRLQDTKDLLLKHNENDFSIEFASLHFANPGKNHYIYKLDGYDNEWMDASSKYPIANYSNLKYGRYKFDVIGTNNDGVWSTSPATVNIRILPPWYYSTLAIIIYLLLAAILTYLSYNIALRWLKIKNKLRINDQMHQMKLRFFTNISHELRTPLTLILSPLEDLLNNKVSPSNQRNVYKMMHSNTNRLLQLINELMDFRKVETGVDTLKASQRDLNEFVRNIAAQFELLAKKKRINFEIDIPPVKNEIWFDKTKIEKVIYNLLSNSFKYTEDEGLISIKVVEDVQNIVLSGNKALHKESGPFSLEEYTGIIISDSGIGISKDSLPDIFNRFFQLEGTSSQKHLGSGVGLALVKVLIQLHKGEIWVSSNRGEGTDFVVLLPKVDHYLQPSEKVEISDSDDSSLVVDVDTYSRESNESIIESKSGIQKKGSTVLIVEDNTEMRNFLKGKLIEEYIVHTANDGEEGIDKAYELLPDIIISDLMMPKKDGLALTRELKDDLETCHIPIVLLTARDAINDQIQGIESGADVYITKPFNFDYLNANVANLILNRKKLIEKFAKDALFEAKDLGQNKKDKEFFDKLYQFIEENLEDANLDSELICRHLGVGRTTLFNKVKGLTDQSLGQFIRSIRLKTAAKYLIVDSLTVSEAAFKVGITSPSYFSRAFKEQFNKTPREFIDYYSEKK